jgi:hypothetical protein
MTRAARFWIGIFGLNFAMVCFVAVFRMHRGKAPVAAEGEGY